MTMTASKLRENVYRVLDGILETGEPVVVERGGRRLRIVADDAPRKLTRLVERKSAVIGDSEDFVHLDWTDEWQP